MFWHTISLPLVLSICVTVSRRYVGTTGLDIAAYCSLSWLSHKVCNVCSLLCSSTVIGDDGLKLPTFSIRILSSFEHAAHFLVMIPPDFSIEVYTSLTLMSAIDLRFLVLYSFNNLLQGTFPSLLFLPITFAVEFGCKVTNNILYICCHSQLFMSI